MSDKINMNLTVNREEVIQALAEGMTHEQTVEAIMALDLHMADMDASVSVLTRLLGSLRQEVAAGEDVKEALKQYDEVAEKLLKILKAGL